MTLVPLDVRVLDRDGKPVVDLTRDDFGVVEDGVRQTVSHFDRQVLAPKDAGAAAPLELRTSRTTVVGPQDRRVFLVAFDPNLWLPGLNWGLSEATTRFLRERLLPQDYAALWAWDRATDMTTDHDSVARVVERLQDFFAWIAALPGKEGIPSYTDFRMNALFGRPLPGLVQEAFDAAFDVGRLDARTLPRVGRREIADLVVRAEGHGTAFARAHGFDERHAALAGRAARIRTFTLYSMIRYLRYLEGEKHLIFVSPYGLHMAALEDERDIARLASDARIAVHVVQTSGMMDVFQAMGSKHLAGLTGGQTFFNQYPDRAFAQIERATRVGYVLGYYPTNPAFDGRHRKITVTVKRPRNATVLYRRSYQATERPVVYDERVFIVQDRILAAGELGEPIRDIPVRAKVTFKPGALAADVVIDLAGVDLQETDGRYSGKLDVALFALDPRQRTVLGQKWQTVDLNLKPETYRRFLAEGFRHAAEVPVKGDVGFIKVVVYDYLSDRMGSAIVRVR